MDFSRLSRRSERDLFGISVSRAAARSWAARWRTWRRDRMNAEIQHLAWIAGKAVLLYATAIIGLRLGKRRILAELSPFDFVAAVAVGAIVGRIPSASDADYLARGRNLNCGAVRARLSLPFASLFERGASRRPKPENTRRQRKNIAGRSSAIRAIPSGCGELTAPTWSA
jgi:hypothetical protein